MNRLRGKVGLITGAAGGIGSAAMRAFVAEGAIVGLIDVPGDPLDRLTAELGDAVVPLPADVREEPEVRAAMAQWGSRFGRADFLYVCAGRQLHGRDGPVGEVDLATWRETIEVNLTGAFFAVKHGIELLCASGSGSLVLCGSPTGMTMCGAGYTAYAASKAGMMSLARTVAADYARRGVRANVIVPGTTATPLIEQLISDPAQREALIAGSPIGRLGTPEDLAGIAVYLVSDDSVYATAASFSVDGGLTQR